jgi:ubiquinone/menaquinone biosynthesis C-methylase UbiE
MQSANRLPGNQAARRRQIPKILSERNKGLAGPRSNPCFVCKLNMHHLIMRFFFHHFYHSFAWTYDFIAAFVSVGRWITWIHCVLPFIKESRVLEIGSGTGHLQELLSTGNLFIVGLDESPQMMQLTKRRLVNAARSNRFLIRAKAESLPFAKNTFDTVVSTFPTESIFDTRTLSDVYRVLPDDGRFVLLPGAWILGKSLLDRSASWLFKITKQTPSNTFDIVSERMRQVLVKQGFNPIFKTVDINFSLVLIMIGDKSRYGYKE